MALLAELTTQEKTDIRSDNHYRALQFLCIVPNEVVVQFQPDAAPSTAVYAEIAVGAVASGDMANIKQAQLVVYSATSDYQQTEVFRTRVRKVSGTSSLYVAENSQGLTTSMYITVLNTYEVQEKLQKSLTLRDWDITFRKLLPIETALPSAVVLTNGDTAYTPPSAPIVMDASANSIDVHAWESSNTNDIFSATNVAQPDITLEAAAFRWLRYTFTDDNGNSNFRVTPVWTIPKNYSFGVHLGVGSASGDFADISFDAELGWMCSIPAFDDIENTINRAFCVVACDEWYNGVGNDDRQSIRTNINFVGYLQNESTNTEGNEAVGHLSETRFTIEGFGHQMARQNISTQTIIRVVSNPNTWGEIQSPTPARMLSYHLSEGSTILNLCSMTIPGDDTDFIGDDLSITNGKMLDDVRFISEVINAELQFDADGKLDLCRNLIYLGDTARDAAAEVVEFLTSDVLSYDIAYSYGSQTSSVEMSGGAFNTSTGMYNPFKAASPAVARRSEGDLFKISNQVLTTNATQTEANTEIGQRAANYDAANQPNFILTATLKDEWYFLVPDVGAWFTFPLTEADTVRGKVFSSNDRWQLVSMGYSTNNLTGRRTPVGVFALETQSTGAMVYTTAIQNDPDADIYYLPAVTSPYSGANLGLTDGIWYDSQDPTPPSDPTPPGVGCESFNVRNSSGGNSNQTTQPALNGEVIQTAVRGSGIVGTVGWCQEWTGSQFASDFTFNAGTNTGGGVTSTVWTPSGLSVREASDIYIDLGAPHNITEIVLEGDIDWGGGLSFTYSILEDNHPASSVISRWTPGQTADLNGTNTLEWSGSISAQVIRVGIQACGGASCSGDATITRVRIAGTGTAPTFASGDACGSGDTVFADAFYTWSSASPVASAMASGYGLQVKGGDVTSIPPYSETHEYVFFETVTSGPVDYSYSTPYSFAEGDPFPLQIDPCFLGVP